MNAHAPIGGVSVLGDAYLIKVVAGWGLSPAPCVDLRIASGPDGFDRGLSLTLTPGEARRLAAELVERAGHAERGTDPP